MKNPLCTYVFMYLWNLFLTKHAVHLHMLEVGKQAHKISSYCFVSAIYMRAGGHYSFFVTNKINAIYTKQIHSASYIH